MSFMTDPTPQPFIDRRKTETQSEGQQRERRQFGNSYGNLSEKAYELATAIDEYKLQHRRRYIDYEEMLEVIESLGYQKFIEAQEQL